MYVRRLDGSVALGPCDRQATSVILAWGGMIRSATRGCFRNPMVSRHHSPSRLFQGSSHRRRGRPISLHLQGQTLFACNKCHGGNILGGSPGDQSTNYGIGGPAHEPSDAGARTRNEHRDGARTASRRGTFLVSSMIPLVQFQHMFLGAVQTAVNYGNADDGRLISTDNLRQYVPAIQTSKTDGAISCMRLRNRAKKTKSTGGQEVLT